MALRLDGSLDDSLLELAPASTLDRTLVATWRRFVLSKAAFGPHYFIYPIANFSTTPAIFN